MSALARYFEEDGIPTVCISLVREHTEVILPPRALWVPFPLGRPLGAPGDPAFQADVLRTALRLLERPDGPLLEDYPHDAPPDDDPSADDGGMACPVNFDRPVPEGDGLAAIEHALLAEIAQLGPWHDIARQRRGGSGVGLAAPTAEGAARILLDLVRAPTAVDARLVKYACDDLRTYYEEAGGAQPGRLSSAAMHDWYYHGTTAGTLLRHVHAVAAASADPAFLRLAQLLILPRTVLNADRA